MTDEAATIRVATVDDIKDIYCEGIKIGMDLGHRLIADGARMLWQGSDDGESWHDVPEEDAASFAYNRQIKVLRPTKGQARVTEAPTRR